MSQYVFFIGGSGARVFTALTHTAAAGILATKEISVLMIDADESNYANKSSINLHESYQKVYEALAGRDRNMFTCKIKMLSDKVLSPVRPETVNLSLAIGNSSEDRSRILKCLYTEEEIRQRLEGGFFAHPNIGCVFFADFKHPEFDACLNRIDQELFNDQDVRIALVGSVFGGTGAAGLPTIYKLIKERLKQNPHLKSRLHIGGILLVPYFKVNGTYKNDKENIPIEMEEFYFNTYEALNYYRVNKDMDFESTYLVGQQELDVVNQSYADSGEKQNNKPHIVELYAALAIDRFFSKPNEKGVFGSVRRGNLDWTGLPGAKEGLAQVHRLADFTRLLTVFVSEVYGYANSIENTYRQKWGIMVPQWYSVYCLKDNGSKQQAKMVTEYGLLYFDWLYKTNSIYGPDETLCLDKNLHLFGPTLQKVYELSTELKKEESGKDIKYMVERIRNGFNELIDTTSNIEYVLDKVFLILSMAGIAPMHTAATGTIALLCKIAALACKHKK